MYGADVTQAGTLAATGIALGVGWNILAAAVLILVGVTALTIVKVARHRATRAH